MLSTGSLSAARGGRLGRDDPGGEYCAYRVRPLVHAQAYEVRIAEDDREARSVGYHGGVVTIVEDFAQDRLDGLLLASMSRMLCGISSIGIGGCFQLPSR